MQKLVKESAEVYYPSSPDLVVVDGEVISFLKREAAKSPRHVCRLCLHSDVNEVLHEMIIAQGKEVYVKPHKHIGKSESFHLIEGELLLVFFSDAGDVEESVLLSVKPGGNSGCRIAEERYHGVIPLSHWVVFREITNGPFQRDDCIFAPWAVDETNVKDVEKYRREMIATLSQ